MGYANTFPYTEIEYPAQSSDYSLTLSTVAADLTINQSFAVPQWIIDRMHYAYLQMELPMEQNTSGAGVNWTNGLQYIVASFDGGVTYENVLAIPSASIGVPASTTTYQHLRFIGAIDMHQYGIASGTTVTLAWDNALASRDNLVLFNPIFTLKCILT